MTPSRKSNAAVHSRNDAIDARRERKLVTRKLHGCERFDALCKPKKESCRLRRIQSNTSATRRLHPRSTAKRLCTARSKRPPKINAVNHTTNFRRERRRVSDIIVSLCLIPPLCPSRSTTLRCVCIKIDGQSLPTSTSALATHLFGEKKERKHPPVRRNPSPQPSPHPSLSSSSGNFTIRELASST